MIRKRIVFYGCVQGVGFRYHAQYAADMLNLTGWVCNEYDGTVTMEVQGEEAEIDRLLQTLNSDRYIDIQDMDVKNLPVDEDERRFRITG
ncbi:MAG: acylphosphatase, partial [Oscillospiraceae bacterium]